MNKTDIPISRLRRLLALLLVLSLLGGGLPSACAEGGTPVDAILDRLWGSLRFQTENILSGGLEEALPSPEPTPAPKPTPTPTPEPTPEPTEAVCAHRWEEGRCALCGASCPHPQHHRATGRCTLCGEYLFHQYRDGVCALCDVQPALLTTFVPDAMVLPSEAPCGLIEPVELPLEELGGSLRFCVYTPPGYDPEGQYNVLVLVGGAGDDHYGWLSSPHDYFGVFYLNNARGEDLVNNMIDAGLVAPLIIVSTYCETLLSVDITNPGEGQFTEILRTVLLPYVVSHYATFAASPAEADISAARDHFGIGGLSDGSLYAQNAGLCGCLDLFANFMCWSGQNQTPTIVETINSNPQYPIRCYVCGAGEDADARLSDVVEGYQEMLEECGAALREGENAWCITSSGWHGWTVWLTGLYNGLQLAF